MGMDIASGMGRGTYMTLETTSSVSGTDMDIGSGIGKDLDMGLSITLETIPSVSSMGLGLALETAPSVSDMPIGIGRGMTSEVNSLTSGRSRAGLAVLSASGMSSGVEAILSAFGRC